MVAVVFLVIALIAVAFAPIFAVGIAVLFGIALLVGASARRSKQVGSEHGAAAQDRREAGQETRSSASARPAAGEGQAAAGQRAAQTRT